MRQRHGQNARKAACNHNQQGITAGIINRRIRCAEESEDRIDEDTDQKGIQRRNRHRAIHAQCADMPGILMSSGSHEPGHMASAANAEQIAQCGIHHHHCQREAGCSHHIGISCSANEKGIHHVVDQIDGLTDHGGYGHGQQGFGNGNTAEQFIFADPCLFHCTIFLLLCKIIPAQLQCSRQGRKRIIPLLYFFISVFTEKHGHCPKGTVSVSE